MVIRKTDNSDCQQASKLITEREQSAQWSVNYFFTLPHVNNLLINDFKWWWQRLITVHSARQMKTGHISKVRRLPHVHDLTKKGLVIQKTLGSTAKSQIYLFTTGSFAVLSDGVHNNCVQKLLQVGCTLARFGIKCLLKWRQCTNAILEVVNLYNANVDLVRSVVNHSQIQRVYQPLIFSVSWVGFFPRICL